MAINRKITDRADDLLVISGCSSLFEGNSKVYAFFGHPFPFEQRLAISNISRGAVTLINSPKHGLQSGQTVSIFGISPMSSVNGYQGKITVIDDDNISVPVDSSSDPAYEGGGVISYQLNKIDQFSSISESELIKTITGLQKVERKDVLHAISRKDWKQDYYKTGDYVNVGFDTFICIEAPTGQVLSSYEPDVEWSSITKMPDGYKWKLIYTPTASEIAAVSGFNDNLVPIGRVFSYGAPHENRWKSKFETVGGQILSIRVVDIGNGYNYSNIDDIKITINGNGQGAKARVSQIVGSGITEIEITDHGQGYTWATVSVFDSSNNGSGARAEAIISPLRGLGYDPIHELKPEWLVINAKLGSGECLESLPVNVPVHTVGLILEPTVDGYPLTQKCVSISDSVTIKDQHGDISVGDFIVGKSSGHRAVITNVSENRIFINSPTGQFIIGETVVTPTGEATVISHAASEFNSLWGTVIYYSMLEGFVRTRDQFETVSLAVKLI